MNRIEELIAETKIKLDVLKDIKKSADEGNKFYTYAIILGKIDAAEYFLKSLEDAQKQLEEELRGAK